MEQLGTEAILQDKQGRVTGGGSGLLIGLGIVGGLLALLAAGYIALCAYAVNGAVIWKNTYVLGQDVGGLTVEQAAQALEAALPGMRIDLYLYDAALGTPPERTGKPDGSIALSDLEMAAEPLGMAEFAKQAAISEGSFLSAGLRYLFRGETWVGMHNVQSLTVDPDSAAQAAADSAAALSQNALDTSYEMGDNALVVQVAQDGRQVDAAQLEDALTQNLWCTDLTLDVPCETVESQTMTAQEIHNAVAGEMKNAGYDAATDTITPEQVGTEFDVPAAQRLLDAAQPGDTVTIPASIEQPAVTAEGLRAVLFRDVLGEASTTVTGTAPRKTNVRLSSEAINNVIMNTGDVFSYNETVGQRTVAKGYGPASAYISGETVDVIGGGICQTSSTLYLACLLSNLEITQRIAHRYTPSYIPWGMDATVSWGGPDYKFTNNTDYPIKIVTTYINNVVTVKILGTKTDDITVKMTNQTLSSTPFEVVYQDDPSLPAGTETVKTTPYTGYKVQTFRNLYDGNGNLISSTYEAASNYQSRNKVILRGPVEEASAVDPNVPVTPPADVPPADIPSTDTPSTDAPPAAIDTPPEDTTFIVLPVLG